MPVFSSSGCCEGQQLHYFNLKEGSTVITTETTIISQVITIPEGTWAIYILATGWVSNSAGGTGGSEIEIVDSVLGVLRTHGLNQAASLIQDFAIQMAVDGQPQGGRTITLRGTDTSGAGAPTVTQAELSISLIPAENVTVSTS